MRVLPRKKVKNEISNENSTIAPASRPPSTYLSENPSELPPPIYSVPTSDTFGDDQSLLSRSYSVNSPSRFTRNFRINQTSLAHSHSPRPVSSSSSHQWTPHKNVRNSAPQTTSISKPKLLPPSKRKSDGARGNGGDAQKCEFQIPKDLMSWQQAAEAASLARKTNMYKRISPSYQYLRLLHHLQSQRVLRQLHFSPSVHLNADPFVRWDDDLMDVKRAQNKEEKLPARPRRHDGRYRSIDPTVHTLPSTSPLLTNHKVRLPNRADVGFPHATEAEIRLKQLELSRETSWEEASPRLVVFVTSDDLGTAFTEEQDGSKFEDHVRWNGGGLPGIPFAGKELIRAKDRNSRYFGGGLTGFEGLLGPDPTSMLAPPLDATYSPSQDWRPRPYHDRPPGLAYYLACPLEVNLDDKAGQEPLVCSLTLYVLPDPSSLPKDCAYGKISEHFWFPAGNWEGKVTLDGARTEDGSIDRELLSALFSRKRKAIFSCDPKTLPGGYDSLYVVLEVHKLSHEPSSRHQAVDVKGKGADGNATHFDSRKAADAVFQQFGSQIQSPLCFGVVKLYDEELVDPNAIEWPRGEMRQLDLQTCSPLPESQESFIERLYAALDVPPPGMESGTKSQPNDDDDVSVASDEAEDIPKKRRGVGRLFRNPKKQSRLKNEHRVAASTRVVHRDTVGVSSVFLSALPVDFLQAVLQTPEPLIESTIDRQKRIPKLLADSSADFAVILDTATSTEDLEQYSQGSKKRSNLVRLPKPSEGAGYASSADFREVTYLPARRDKHHQVDRSLSQSSLCNLLFLYPKLLRFPKSESAKGTYCIGLRIMHSISTCEVDGEVHTDGLPQASFYSPSPWSGPALLESWYTRVVGNPIQERKAATSVYCLPMRDEIKVSLPPILDGTFSLEVTLYSVMVAGDGSVTLHPIAESQIPLSSSSYRESGSTSRVTTVVPNGNHRLKLGDFQLQLETRLLGSLHIGDPNVATIFRDFPFLSDEEVDEVEPNIEVLRATSRSVSTVGSTLAMDSIVPLLKQASESTILSYFAPLLHLHASHLVDFWGDKKKGRESDDQKAYLTLVGLLTALGKAKNALASLSTSECPGNSVRIFIKSVVDSFDERGLVSSLEVGIDGERDDDLVGSIPVAATVSVDDAGENKNGDELKRDPARLSRTHASSHGQNIPVSRIVGSRGPTNAPFSRVAFGATKTERMRLEAEMRRSAETGFQFDDDETVLTAPSIQSLIGNGVNLKDRHSIDILSGLKDRGAKKKESSSDDNSIVRIEPSSSSEKGVNGSDATNGQTEFATRVRTAAQTILAPCVGPSISNMLAPRRKEPTKSPNEKQVRVEVKAAAPRDIQKTQPSMPTSSSDIDEDDFELDKDCFYYRGSGVNSSIPFSVSKSNGDESVLGDCGKFLYETILIQWLQAWAEYVNKDSSGSTGHSSSSAARLKNFKMPHAGEDLTAMESIFCFYAHMDFLLPLFLKSMISRFGEDLTKSTQANPRIVLDDNHLLLLEPFVESLARGLMGLATSSVESKTLREKSLVLALSSSNDVLEFLTGLFAVLHPQHMDILLLRFFRTLRECEIEFENNRENQSFEWTEDSIHRVRCSRQLRLLAIETFFSLPSFLAVNFPLKYLTTDITKAPKKATWLHQFNDIEGETDGPKGNTGQTSKMLPRSGWLAALLIREGLSVCAISCESVVAEAMAHAELTDQDSSRPSSSLQKRPGKALNRNHLLMFQSIGIHAITVIYEVGLRRHAMDERYQTESARERLAAIFVEPILEKSTSSVRWLARMESTHKVRSLWLLSLAYVLQEAPASVIQQQIRSFCLPSSGVVRIHRFIRLLRLSSSTFQSFLDLQRHATFPSDFDKDFSPWLLQESFNTVCAATNTVVEECVALTSSYPHEQRKIIQGVLDLLLHLLTTPQSSVTHLRAVGGALQALENFGAGLFLEIAGINVQNWVRVMLSLMNSVSLSVRCISVDFVVSLLGSTFDVLGSIDEIAIVFASVLPEVVARELALYSVSGHISTVEDLSTGIWPLRRALADIGDANPLDDDRIDPQLAPILSQLARACQALIDGVLVEMRLKGDHFSIVGTRLLHTKSQDTCFDADEESIYEGVSFFLPETAPMQRIRWILTLKSLHESKKQWLEAAEALFLCAKTIVQAMPVWKQVWRPSRFVLWSDSRRSIWLDTVGEDLGQPNRGNQQVMDFAEEYLEPPELLGTTWRVGNTGKLRHPTIPTLCEMLTNAVQQGVKLYSKESNVDSIAYTRLEKLQKQLLEVLDDHTVLVGPMSRARVASASARKYAEEEAAMRKALTVISAEVTNLADVLLRVVEREPPSTLRKVPSLLSSGLIFVAVHLSGKKPARFLESTSFPAFLEWNTACIFRVPYSITSKVNKNSPNYHGELCTRVGKPWLQMLQNELSNEAVIFRTSPLDGDNSQSDDTYLSVYPLEPIASDISSHTLVPIATRRFLGKYTTEDGRNQALDMTVAQEFPCTLSRQQVVLRTEIQRGI